MERIRYTSIQLTTLCRVSSESRETITRPIQIRPLSSPAAIDAGATFIEVHVDVSKYLVRVSDNGHGLTLENLQLAGERYGVLRLFVYGVVKERPTFLSS